MRERSFAISRSRTCITTLGEEEFRIALKSSQELRIRGGPWPKPWPRTTPLPASIRCTLRTHRGGGGDTGSRPAGLLLVRLHARDIARRYEK